MCLVFFLYQIFRSNQHYIRCKQKYVLSWGRNLSELTWISCEKWQRFRVGLRLGIGVIVNWQHSVDFWLYSDLMAPANERLIKSVRRVTDQAQADVFYIPFFSTIPFFLFSRPQSRVLYRVRHILPSISD